MKSRVDLVSFLGRLRREGNIEALQDMGTYRGTAQYTIHEMMHLKSTSGPEPQIEDIWINSGNDRFENDRRAYGPKFDY